MDGDFIIPFSGQLLLFIAIIFSANQIFRYQNAGNNLTKTLASIAQVSPFLLLVLAFIFDFSSLKLVTEYGGADLPLLYRISAVWGGRAGPLLLFAALLSLVTWFMTDTFGTSIKTKRCSLLVNDGIIEKFFVEVDGGKVDVSGANKMLDLL